MQKQILLPLFSHLFRANSVASAFAFALIALPALAAPTETVLHSFGVVPNGYDPETPLVASGDGGYYGTTAGGGAGGVGTVFKIMPPGKGETIWHHTVLYSFRNDGIDGAYPSSVIADKRGALYGTTAAGGPAGLGTVFKLTPPAASGADWTKTVLYSFKNSGADGGSAGGPLIFDATGALYGTTGGGRTNPGTTFKLTPPGPKQTSWTETVIYPIESSSGALVADKNGTLYGTTSGFWTNDGGSVFKLTPPANGATSWTKTTLHRFTETGSDYAGGYNPGGGLIIDASGTLYGTTIYGSSGGSPGIVFSLTPPARGGTWTFSKLAEATGQIFAPVIADPSGNLYSTATYTDYDQPFQTGTVFKLTRPASGKADWTISSIYTTTDNLVSAVVVDATGALYGTAAINVQNATGDIFKLTPPASGDANWAASVIYKFDSSTDGVPYTFPSMGALVADPSGALYGTTPAGGLYGVGTAFKLTPSGVGNEPWTETILYSFGAGSTDGTNPTTALLAGPDGVFYGATPSGGPHEEGIVFELAPPTEGQTKWTEKIISEFGSFSNLVAGKSGTLYGTVSDFTSDDPSIFELTPPSVSGAAWTLTVVYSFGAAQQYNAPFLSSDPSGALYEVLSSNTVADTVFKVTPPGAGETVWTGTKLHSFVAPGPWGLAAPVLFGKDGVLYGTSACSGTYERSNNCGAVFSLTPPAAGHAVWTESVLHHFGSQGDGAYPDAGLIADASGALYGTTINGGSAKGYQNCPSGCGTVFKLTPPAPGHTVWTEKRLYDFKGESDGANPTAALMIDKSGNLYGTTTSGGNGAAGVVFKITP